ncbi:recombinase family protein [Spirosoma sp. RP8]|uniref:Recombinase family protein n=1 Tax=Spirosoma liriopis TaxID=2937440 RepID=A0ABT0HQ53_9BACT|nr:recombinase family protein [Spirosoma liriopis]MCK8493778.1 recombinase family protein [Spirosoma liriopis]
MKIGYARVSTHDQNLDLQIAALQKEECGLIFQEKVGGGGKDRPQLNHMMQRLRPGDEVVVWKLDRLGRNLTHLIEIVETFAQIGVTFFSINDKIDTSTASGKLVFHIFCSLAEFERAQTRERTMAGLVSARLKGNIGGRPKGLSEESQKAARIAESLYLEGYSIKLIANQLKLSRMTVYKYLNFRGVKNRCKVD